MEIEEAKKHDDYGICYSFGIAGATNCPKLSPEGEVGFRAGKDAREIIAKSGATLTVTIDI